MRVGRARLAARVKERRLSCLVRRGLVVAKGQVLAWVLSNNPQVIGLNLKLHTLLGPHALDVSGVAPANHHVREEERLAADVHGLKHGVRLAVVRVDVGEREHAANLGIGDELVAELVGLRARHKHVVRGLIDELLALLAALAAVKDDVRHIVGVAAHVVDLVERQPVLHTVAEALEDDLAVPQEELDEAAVAPVAVLLNQRDGHLVVADGHHGLDAVRNQAVKEAVVKGEARLVGLHLLARGEDARPVDGRAKHL